MCSPQPPALALAPKALEGGVDDKRHDAQLPRRALEERHVAITPENPGHGGHFERVVGNLNDAGVLCSMRWVRRTMFAAEQLNSGSASAWERTRDRLVLSLIKDEVERELVVNVAGLQRRCRAAG